METAGDWSLSLRGLLLTDDLPVGVECGGVTGGGRDHHYPGFFFSSCQLGEFVPDFFIGADIASYNEERAFFGAVQGREGTDNWSCLFF